VEIIGVSRCAVQVQRAPGAYLPRDRANHATDENGELHPPGERDNCRGTVDRLPLPGRGGAQSPGPRRA
jgi:hypothetical protein